MRGGILQWLCMVNLILMITSDVGNADASVKLLPSKQQKQHPQNRLSCLPCDGDDDEYDYGYDYKYECPSLKKKDCPWGFALDVCGCCKVCAKAPGEPCGGQWNMGGTCGRGLECFGEASEDGEKGLGDTDDEWPEGKGLCTPQKYCACGLPWKRVTKA